MLSKYKGKMISTQQKNLFILRSEFEQEFPEINSLESILAVHLENF